MAMRYKARRRVALLVLLVGLPLYIVVAVNLVARLADWLGRPSFWVELAVYLGLGIVWMLPLRSVFRGIGQPDPEARDRE